MQIELVFLGTSGALPTRERGSSAIYGKTQKNSFLLDCGENAQRQLLRYNLDFFVDWIAITHYHLDHFAGLIPYLATQKLLGRVKPLKLYLPKVAYIIEIGLAYKADFWTSLGYKVDFVEICEGRNYIQNEDIVLEFIHVSHGIKCYGVQLKSLNNTTYDKEKLLKWGSETEVRKLIKEGFYSKKEKTWFSKDFIKNNELSYNIIYSADTIVLDKLLQKYITSKNCLLIHECTYTFKEDESTAVKNSHTHLNHIIDKVLELESGVSKGQEDPQSNRKLILTHFGNKVGCKVSNLDSTMFLKFFKKKEALKANFQEKLLLAKDGLKITINYKKELFKIDNLD